MDRQITTDAMVKYIANHVIAAQDPGEWLARNAGTDSWKTRLTSIRTVKIKSR